MGGAEGCFCVTGKMEMGLHHRNEAAAGKTGNVKCSFIVQNKYTTGWYSEDSGQKNPLSIY